MRKLLMLIILGIIAMPSMSTGIDIKREQVLQHSGMRMPSAEKILADYSNNEITIHISHYSGIVKAYVLDAKGEVVTSNKCNISDAGNLLLNLPQNSLGDYTLRVITDSNIYYGQFYIVN